MTMSAGHLIVKTLEAHGVERIYAVPGESYLDVLDGLHDSSIHTVVTRHEGGAGFMALAEGRLGETPGIAMVTRGPGAANAMIAIHTAWQDATAMVLFVGLIPLADRGRDSFQEFSLEGWFSTTAKAVFVLDDEHQAGDVVARAMRLASTGRPGPVVVGLPEDVLVRMTSSPVPPVLPLPDAAPSAAALESLSAMLARGFATGDHRRRGRLGPGHLRQRLPTSPRPPACRCWPTGAPTTRSTTTPPPTPAGWATAAPNARCRR